VGSNPHGDAAVKGVRTQLDTAQNLKADPKAWHEIKIVHQADQIHCYLNGEHLLTAEDEAITRPGRVGVWTKADAQTYFAQLTVMSIAK